MGQGRWTDKHGADEFYDKFKVTRVSTGEPVEQFFFVLLPEADEAACDALIAYADAVEWRAPNLAKQIRDRVGKIRMENQNL